MEIATLKASRPFIQEPSPHKRVKLINKSYKVPYFVMVFQFLSDLSDHITANRLLVKTSIKTIILLIILDYAIGLQSIEKQ